MVQRRNDTTLGFTIVELLIVIVVIGILASISIVAYRGVQERAHNAKTVTVVRQYQRILETFAVDNDERLPRANWACLGEIEDYPATDGFDEGWCYKPTPTTLPLADGEDHPVDLALNERLHTVTPRLPSGKTPSTVAYLGRTYRGIFYDSSVAGLGNKPAIMYYLKGAQGGCPVGKVQLRGANYTSCLLQLSSVQE